MRQIRFASGIHYRLGEAEIDDLHLQLRPASCTTRQHDIARLQVPMDQTVGRRSNQCLRDLDCNFQGHF
jgi:hypothetical protein